MTQVFVYGSLRKGMYNYEKYLRGNAQFKGYGFVKGELYSLLGVDYPALLQGDDFILGEIYEITHETAMLLDELEGYQPNNTNNDYDKIMSEIQLKDQNIIISLPVYFFNMNKPGNLKMLGEKLKKGDYVAYMHHKEHKSNL